MLCSKMARVQGCWIQISVKFSYCTQFIHWGVWVAVWPCLLGPWAPPSFPSRRPFLYLMVTPQLACCPSKRSPIVAFGDGGGRKSYDLAILPLSPNSLGGSGSNSSASPLCFYQRITPGYWWMCCWPHCWLSTVAHRWEASSWTGSSSREKPGPHWICPGHNTTHACTPSPCNKKTATTTYFL